MFVNVGKHTICVCEQTEESQCISSDPSETPLPVDVINPNRSRKFEVLGYRGVIFNY